MFEVRSEVTGSVWEIVATVGGRVEADDEIVVLESMKMEIPVVTPVAGTLVELLVQSGQSVNAGDVIGIVEES